MIHLYDFQQQALDAEARHRREHPDETRLAIVLPTGTGKGTILAERAMRHIEEREQYALDRAYDSDLPPLRQVITKVLILVHTDELVQDLAKRCELALRPASVHGVGIVKAGQDEVAADIIVASVQTLANPERRARITDVGLVIVDEFDYGMSAYIPILQHFGCFGQQMIAVGNVDQMRQIADYLDTLPPTPALGFTATPERTDGAGLGAVWQNVVFTRDISWAVRKGFLVQPIGYRLEIEIHRQAHVTALGYSGPEYLTTGVPSVFAMNTAEQDAQLCDSIAPERIVEKWQELAADRQTIVFAPLVRSANMIAKAFRAAGITAEIVHGDMGPLSRRVIIDDFRRGEIQVLVNAMVLTRGFDHPNVSCVIVARPTKSRPLFIQMAGRGLRRQPGIPVEDQDCILITLADATSDICSVADLSDRSLDRKADGPLTVMEDAFDIGRDLEEATRHWAGRVDATRFDPIVSRSSKVWARTKDGHWFLPISTDREYVFIPDASTSIYLLTRPTPGRGTVVTQGLHADLPDLELAMQVAEDEATERGGDLGALLADKTRPWRKQVPKEGDKMLTYASRLGLDGEVARILAGKAGGKAGKVSDLIRKVEASRSIDKAVERMRERANA